MGSFFATENCSIVDLYRVLNIAISMSRDVPSMLTSLTCNDVTIDQDNLAKGMQLVNRWFDQIVPDRQGSLPAAHAHWPTPGTALPSNLFIQRRHIDVRIL